jgi:hypothetical protein
MEARLQVERKPLRKLIREDCISLGLVSKDRAEALVNGLAGRTREQAEADIVAELRNNLHQQIRQYIRRHKGGPWSSPKAQEELRLDVVATHHIHGVLTLARQVLQERQKWESSQKKGVMQSLLGGKLKRGFSRE